MEAIAHRTVSNIDHNKWPLAIGATASTAISFNYFVDSGTSIDLHSAEIVRRRALATVLQGSYEREGANWEKELMSVFFGILSIESKFQQVNTAYKISNKQDTESYLKRIDGILDLLIYISTNIFNYFKTSDILTLELMNDPEDMDSEFLSVTIITDESNDNAIERLDMFQREYLSNIIEIARNNICFDVDYK